MRLALKRFDARSKNKLKPWQRKMWCIPPDQNADFVAKMEQVLEVYAKPYDAAYPVVCMDEQPKQLLGEITSPITSSQGRRLPDHEYVREGVCSIWMFNEPLSGWRDVRVTPRRTAVDWAQQIQCLVDDPRFADAVRIRLVCDNLNTHKMASLYQTFAPAEAARIADRIE